MPTQKIASVRGKQTFKVRNPAMRAGRKHGSVSACDFAHPPNSGTGSVRRPEGVPLPVCSTRKTVLTLTTRPYPRSANPAERRASVRRKKGEIYEVVAKYPVDVCGIVVGRFVARGRGSLCDHGRE